MVEAEERFIEAFKELQRQKRMNLTGFAEATGTNKSVLCTYKNGNTNRQPKIEWFVEICKHYGVSPEWLLLGVGDMFRP